LNILTELAGEFDIHLLVHEGGAPVEGLSELRSRSITVHVAPGGVAPKRGWLFPLRIAASLARGLPYSVHSHDRAAYRRTVRALLRAHSFDLLHCEWTPYAVYAGGGSPPWCVAAHNVEWEIWRRMAEASHSMLYKPFLALQAQLMRRFEERVFRTSRHATAVSDADASALRDLGCPHVVVVPNGVDLASYTPARLPSEPRTVVFTGSLDWRPNQDAIRWFIAEVHPRLRASVSYSFYVVGRTPPAWLLDRSAVPPEIVVTGTVDDVRPWIARGEVFVVPLRAGGGSRLKILEALAMERPTVSTTVGAEGLEVEAGRHLLIADDPASFADAIVGLFRDPLRRALLGTEGRQRVEQLYGWKRIAPRQADFWRGVIESTSL
jgi:glycosyltransferase involved in cell wall biosynthesis